VTPAQLVASGVSDTCAQLSEGKVESEAKQMGVKAELQARVTPSCGVFLPPQRPIKLLAGQEDSL